VPTIEQLYDKLCLLERQLSEMRDGFTLSDDIVADFFNQNTVPGREAENPRIDILENVQIVDGRAVLISPSEGNGYLQTTPVQTRVTDIHAVELRPRAEDIRCQVVVKPDSVTQETKGAWLGVIQDDALNVEIVPDTGQRDYGARLIVQSNDRQYLVRNSFIDGEFGTVWFPPKSSILWETVPQGGGSYDYVLRCVATEPLVQFPLPQYSLAHYGLALWADILLKSMNGISASFRHMSGDFNVGFALNMENSLDGLFVMFEREVDDSWIRLYRIASGQLTKIDELPYVDGWVTGQNYEASARLENDELVVIVDGVEVLRRSVEYMERVEQGEFGVAVRAASIVEFNWIEAEGIHAPLFIAPEGEVYLESYTSGDDIEIWNEIEVDTSILSGTITIEYSTDGLAYQPVPMATIEYPDAITKRFNIDSIPVVSGQANTLFFRVQMGETGVGWFRGLNVSYRTIPVPMYLLNNMVTSVSDGFRLVDGELSGSVEMLYDIVPDQNYQWERIVKDEYRQAQFVPVASIVSASTVTVDSEQDGYTADLILDETVETFWESKRGEASYVMFDFPSPVEIHGFRWVKKSVTEGAVYYRAQYYNEEQEKFVDIHAYGYEVNADIRHDFPAPVTCSRFRLWIDCVQPMSYGNARFIDIFGRILGGKVEINYEYSLDQGTTWTGVSGLLSLTAIPPEMPLRLRAIVTRDDPQLDVFLRYFGARFVGRSSKGIQISDIKYDVTIGNREVQDIAVNKEVDMRGVIGSTFILAARFLVHPDYRHELLKPSLSGYRFAVSASKYQTQIDYLMAHIHGVLARADRDPVKDELADAIIMLIGHELDEQRQTSGEQGSIVHGLLNVLQKELSAMRSRLVKGDVGHLDEVLPSIVRRANILEE
jgi:hypothetical protein